MEAKEPPSFGKSLPVPCVQELAKEGLTSIPDRYVRPGQDPPIVPSTVSLPRVPIIDMQKLLADAKEYDSYRGVNSELEKFHHACKDWGFFQLINHGVSSDLVEKVKKEIELFFKLPMEEKKKWWQKSGEVEGFGQLFVVSKEQKLDWADVFFCTTLPIHLRKPHLFPQLPISLRDTLEAYSQELRVLALKLLNTVAKALKMEGEEMEQLFEEGLQTMRMNYYPPCPEPESVIGLKPHSDGSAITILSQLNEIDGLQIKKDGKWVPIKPIPDAFVVNLGDILEILTNGNYRSVEHRATVNSEKERLSIATFYSPNMDGELGPLPSIVTPTTPALFRRSSVKDYFQGFFSRELKGKSSIEVMRI